jgi:hypothetical protein
MIRRLALLPYNLLAAVYVAAIEHLCADAPAALARFEQATA